MLLLLCCVWVDTVDLDGDLDLYLSSNVSARLFINNGSGYFVDVAASVGVATPRSPVLVDVDQDGTCSATAWLGKGHGMACEPVTFRVMCAVAWRVL